MLEKKLNFDDKGLIPAIIQDFKTGEVLTLCYMDRDALRKTFETEKIHVFRRSKKRVMLKGEVSGNTQTVKQVFVDCANNSLLFKVDQKCAACHEGYFSCYFRKVNSGGDEEITARRLFNPDDIYNS